MPSCVIHKLIWLSVVTHMYIHLVGTLYTRYAFCTQHPFTLKSYTQCGQSQSACTAVCLSHKLAVVLSLGVNMHSTHYNM